MRSRIPCSHCEKIIWIKALTGMDAVLIEVPLNSFFWQHFFSHGWPGRTRNNIKTAGTNNEKSVSFPAFCCSICWKNQGVGMTGFGVTRIHRKIWRGDALRWLSMNVFPSTSPASFRMQFLVACQRSSRRLRHWSWRFPGTMGGERRRMPSRPYKVSGALVCHLTQSRRKRNGMYCFGVFFDTVHGFLLHGTDHRFVFCIAVSEQEEKYFKCHDWAVLPPWHLFFKNVWQWFVAKLSEITATLQELNQFFSSLPGWGQTIFFCTRMIWVSMLAYLSQGFCSRYTIYIS